MLFRNWNTSDNIDLDFLIGYPLSVIGFIGALITRRKQELSKMAEILYIFGMIIGGLVIIITPCYVLYHFIVFLFEAIIQTAH